MQSIFNSLSSSFSDSLSLSKSSLNGENRRTYEVKFADTEESISLAHKITIKQLREYNALPIDSINIKFKPGQILYVSAIPKSPKIYSSNNQKSNNSPSKSYFSSFR